MSFVPGLELSHLLFQTAVEPLLDRHAPGLPYAAGLIGAGSDVLGFDTERSTDHDWGPRLIVFLANTDLEVWKPRLETVLMRHLPATIGGHSTRFVLAPDGVKLPAGEATDDELLHGVVVTSVEEWLANRHGLASLGDLTPATWITLSEQRLLETTSGRIFRDDIGTVAAMRSVLSWYSEDIWRYRLAAQWMRIDQLEPFVGRCGEVGDDLGSQLVAMTLVRDVMKLAFLLERQYAPYPKWFGSGFARLRIAPDLQPHLDQARFATTWPIREAGLVAAYVRLVQGLNDLDLTTPIDATPRSFHSRPFTVISGVRIADALLDSITDPDVRRLPVRLGGIDQYIDSTDAMNAHDLHHAIRRWIADSGAERVIPRSSP